MKPENKNQDEFLNDEELTRQMKQRGSGKKLLKFLGYLCGAIMLIAFVCQAYVVAFLFVVLGGVCVVFSAKKGTIKRRCWANRW